jgi:hypothetical protein
VDQHTHIYKKQPDLCVKSLDKWANLGYYIITIMAKAKKRARQQRKKRMIPKLRSAAIVRAAERAHSAAGGLHKDKRNRRKNRKSWRKEYLDEDGNNNE